MSRPSRWCVSRFAKIKVSRFTTCCPKTSKSPQSTYVIHNRWYGFVTDTLTVKSIGTGSSSNRGDRFDLDILKQNLSVPGDAIRKNVAEKGAKYVLINADFIQRYIFPGGMLPTKTIIAEQAERAGLALRSVTPFGDSYARTLAEWRSRFLNAWPAIEKLGFRPNFRRLWEYYLAYCEAGFRTGSIEVNLYTLDG